MPPDRESAYWLNVLEIPPKPQREVGPNQLQLSFRTRIKLFYRPSGISSAAAESYEGLRFEYVKSAAGVALRVSNPTPFHQTLLKIGIGKSKDHILIDVEPPTDMLEPGGQALLPLAPGTQPLGSDANAFASLLNDFGTVVDIERPLTPDTRDP